MAKVLFLLYIPEDEEIANTKKRGKAKDTFDSTTQNEDGGLLDGRRESSVDVDEPETSVDGISHLLAQGKPQEQSEFSGILKPKDGLQLSTQDSSPVFLGPGPTEALPTTSHVPGDKTNLSKAAEQKPQPSHQLAPHDTSNKTTIPQKQSESKSIKPAVNEEKHTNNKTARPSDEETAVPQIDFSTAEEVSKPLPPAVDRNEEKSVTSAEKPTDVQNKQADSTAGNDPANGKMVKKVKDDFWDFGTTSSATPTIKSDAAEPTADTQEAKQNEDKFYDCTEETKQPEMTGTKMAEKAWDKVIEEEPADSAYATCPNTPALSTRSPEDMLKGQSKVAAKSDPSSDESKLVSGKFDIKPVAEPATTNKPAQVSDTSTVNPAPDPVADNPKPILAKFDVKPVSSEQLLKESHQEKSMPTSVPLTEDPDQQKAIPLAVVPAGESTPALARKRGDSLKTGTQVELVDFLKKTPMKKDVQDCLKGLGVTGTTWKKCFEDRIWQVTFIEDSGTRCEDIILKLESIGVGRVKKSSISIIPVSIHTEVEDEVEVKKILEEQDNNENEEREKHMAEKTSEFMQSVKSRLVVQQVVKSVESNAGFTFDYVMLVILASVIAALGLVENSSVILVASMLISPLMGPILAGTFGTVIKNDSLRNLGVKSELYGLGICLLCGAVCGMIAASLEAGSLNWRSGDEWPTLEMTSRGVVRGIFVGALIALPSGAGVALSVLGGNTGSLVGVAISASLLPPAVNAGMLWSAAAVAAAYPPTLYMQEQTNNVTQKINGTEVVGEQTIFIYKMSEAERGMVCPHIKNNEYIHTYTCSVAADLAALGTISLLLTILNIICIFLMGIIVLRIKEVARITSTRSDRSFFKNDIKVARESYTTTKGFQASLMGQKWLEEYKMLKVQLESRSIKEGEEDDTLEFQKILQSVENSPEVRQVLGRVGVPNRPESTPELAVPESEQMSPCFDEAFKAHLRKHQGYHSVYDTIGHQQTLNIPKHLRNGQSVYNTMNRTVVIYPTSPCYSHQSRHFPYPTSAQPFAMIPEGEVLKFEPANRSVRLKVPKKNSISSSHLEASQSDVSSADVWDRGVGKRGLKPKGKVGFNFAERKRWSSLSDDLNLTEEDVTMLLRGKAEQEKEAKAAKI